MRYVEMTKGSGDELLLKVLNLSQSFSKHVSLTHTDHIYYQQSNLLLLSLFFKEIFQDLAEQKSEKSLDELRATSLKVQRILAAHKVIQQRCDREKHQVIFPT